MKGPRQVVEMRNPANQRDSTRPFDAEEHPEKQPRQKRVTDHYRHEYQVSVTRRISSIKDQDIAEWAQQHIAEYGGEAEVNPGIPHMLFGRSVDAHRFADALHSRLGIPKEHIEVKKHK
jgi:hypothetical protein